MIKKYKKYTIICFFIFLLIILSYLFINKYKKLYTIKEFEEKMDAYVINLNTRPDRFNKLTKYFFDKLNLIRIPGVHMNTDLKKRYYNNVKLPDGAIGCALSYMKILNLAKQTGLKTVLTMEDDCKPTTNFSSWPTIKTWLDDNLDKWDIYNGGTIAYNYTDKNTIKPICKINDDIKFYKIHSVSSQFWYINSKCFDKLLSWEQTMIEAIDTLPNILKLDVLTSTPFITIQETGLSDIGGHLADTRDLFINSESVISKIENPIIC